MQYYNEKEANKYSNNTHIIEVQSQLTERALEILAFPPEKKALILDIGYSLTPQGQLRLRDQRLRAVRTWTRMGRLGHQQTHAHSRHRKRS